MYWLIEDYGGSFNYAEAWEKHSEEKLDNLIHTDLPAGFLEKLEQESYTLFKPGFMPIMKDYLIPDWFEGHAYKKSDDSFREIMEDFEKRIHTNAGLSLRCMDGCCWKITTADEYLCNIVKKEVECFKSIKIREQNS